ncbi:MAG: DUF4349 domain-containing protein, partial [Eubacteriales bacterium]|nr:DUF4349 domain-containing protein [Eubacteriales bacterium]
MKKYHLKPSVQTLTILLLVLLLLTGCSSGDEKGYEMSNASNYREAGYQSTVSQEADYDGGYYETEMLYEEVSGDEASRAEEGPDQTQKLVYKASLEIETLAYKDTMNAIYQLIEEKNGFVASESTSDSNYSWYRSYDSGESMMTTTMTIRIPSEQYQSFLKGIDGSGGRVTRRSQSVENITRKYNDQSVLVKAL